MSNIPRSDCSFYIAVIIAGLFTLFILFSPVNASCNVIYTETYTFDGNVSRGYDLKSNNGDTWVLYELDLMFVDDIETINFENMVLTVEYENAAIDQRPTNYWGTPYTSYYEKGTVKEFGTETELGTIMHGYTMGPTRFSYNIYFNDDCDFSAYSGQQKLTFSILEDFIFDTVKENYEANIWSEIDSGEISLGCDRSSYGYSSVVQEKEQSEDWYTHYNICNFANLRNDFVISRCSGGYYTLDVIRNISGWEGDVASGWVISTDTYEYLNETGFTTDDVTVYAFPPLPEFCDELTININGASGCEINDVIEGLCTIEAYEFDLWGRTYDVNGNIITGVYVTLGDQYTTSDATGAYSFSEIVVGEYTLNASKSGYFDVNDTIAIFTAGNYYHPIILIPKEVLDTSEFGGIIYDYCTLEPSHGAYVYLFNETASSGNYVYSNKQGFYRFAGLTEGLKYQVSASKEGYEGSIVHSFTFNETNLNESYCKVKNIWLLPEGGCPEDEGGGIPTATPAPTPTPHEWTNEEIVSWLRTNLMIFFIVIFLFTFLWFIRRAGGSRR